MKSLDKVDRYPREFFDAAGDDITPRELQALDDAHDDFSRTWLAKAELGDRAKKYWRDAHPIRANLENYKNITTAGVLGSTALGGLSAYAYDNAPLKYRKFIAPVMLGSMVGTLGSLAARAGIHYFGTPHMLQASSALQDARSKINSDRRKILAEKLTDKSTFRQEVKPILEYRTSAPDLYLKDLYKVFQKHELTTPVSVSPDVIKDIATNRM